MANQYGASRNLMKQTCNKNVGTRVDVLKWSQEMDLLAMGTEKGEVLLHRLKWQKVWQLSPPEDGLKVRGLAWRPCEKFIAIGKACKGLLGGRKRLLIMPCFVVGYSNGTILLVDLETKEEIHSFSVKQDITCLTWTENTDEIGTDDVSHSSVVSGEAWIRIVNPNITNAPPRFLPDQSHKVPAGAARAQLAVLVGQADQSEP